MKKVHELYKREYQDIIIELKKYSSRVYLYVDGNERDYWNIGIKGRMLQCKFDEQTRIKVLIEPKMLKTSATVYVNNTQIGYVSSL